MLVQKRKDRRVRCRRAAAVILNEKVTDCVLLDISKGGARLGIENLPAILPPRFTLLLTRNGAVQRKCRVAWRSGSTIGIQFVGASSGARKS
jgi:hypothetical protein